MKLITIALSSILFVFSTNAFSKTEYEITCKHNDCLTYGWSMQAKKGNYRLDNTCMNHNCREYGWMSKDSNGHEYIVRCKDSSCFESGWHSYNHVEGKIYRDEVTCKGKACLTYGWTVKSGYDLSGGNVTCGNYDCATNGGVSFWRGRASRTVCKDWDCYGKGWWLTIF